MARPRTANPKKEFIGTKTTNDLKVRFDKVCERKNLKGDDWLVLFLGVFEIENIVDNNLKEINVYREKIINKFKKFIIDNLSNKYYIKFLFYGSYSTGLSIESSDIDKALSTVLQRFNMQSVYTISEWVDENRPFIENQAYVHGVNYEELEQLILDNS